MPKEQKTLAHLGHCAYLDELLVDLHGSLGRLEGADARDELRELVRLAPQLVVLEVELAHEVLLEVGELLREDVVREDVDERRVLVRGRRPVRALAREPNLVLEGLGERVPAEGGLEALEADHHEELDQRESVDRADAPQQDPDDGCRDR